MPAEIISDALIDYIDVPDIARGVDFDVLKLAPGLTIDQAYQLQFRLMARRVERGDPIAGYQASFTSSAMMRQFPDMVAPYFGTILASNVRREAAPIEMTPGVGYSIEAEIGVLLKRDLAGPGVTRAEVCRSVEGVFGTVECATTRPRNSAGKIACSQHHMIATHNTDSHILVGATMRSLDFDLRLEGVALSVNGIPFSSGAGVEALGNPLNVVAEMANWLGHHGRTLRAGDFLITGALPAAPRLTEPASITVEYASLGSITCQLV